MDYKERLKDKIHGMLAGVAIGALAGFLYWKFVGCSSGSCAITSKPINSTMYGAVMGGLLLSIFQNNINVLNCTHQQTKGFFDYEYIKNTV